MIKIIDLPIAQRLPRWGRGAEYFRRKDCALTAPAEGIAQMNAKVDYVARNVVANTTRLFVAPAKTSSILS